MVCIELIYVTFWRSCFDNKEYWKGNVFLQGQKNGLFPAVYSKTDVMEAQLACSRNVPLDENHSHFILIDDGSENKFGGEIEFRTSLEKYISEQSVDPDDKESCKWFLCVMCWTTNSLSMYFNQLLLPGMQLYFTIYWR